jgi:hypothetical protein
MGSFSNQSILTVARKMLGGATDLLLGCLVGCVTDWQQETRGLFYFCPLFCSSPELRVSATGPGLENPRDLGHPGQKAPLEPFILGY